LAYEIVFYKEDDGSIPLLEWTDHLELKASAKIYSAMKRLSAWGYELRRPAADYLRDGIYELRIMYKLNQYRVLYFFHGTSIIVISHGLRKTDIVPVKEIERAIARKREFERDPEKHTGDA
jgi:phage-related protein